MNDWALEDLKNINKNGLKVFSCFACGGGSSMGYKLAGYEVVGFNEIDKRMSDLYMANVPCEYAFTNDIRELVNEDLPEKVIGVDILDGSPPCTTFSMAGLREESWGVEKKFQEGQQCQTLDDLPFIFLDLAKKIRPKVIVMENVSGMMIGNAQKYVARMYQMIDELGYQSQHFMLCADTMEVPQSRNRFILLALRNDLCGINEFKLGLFTQLPFIDMLFGKKLITLGEILVDSYPKSEKSHYLKDRFGDVICKLDRPMPTITTKGRYFLDENTRIGKKTIALAGTFPPDYNYLKQDMQYVIGMSVPPMMMKNIALRIKEHWLDKV